MAVLRKKEFAELHGVTPARVSQWLAAGYIDGAALVGAGRAAQIVVEIANEQLRERLDQTRRLAFTPSENPSVSAAGGGVAGDEDDLLSPGFSSKRVEREGLHADLLRIRLARERGELISRAAQLEAAKSAGRAVARSWQALPTWAEEIFGVCQSGGVPALSTWLRAKADDQCSQIADIMAMATDGDEESESIEG